MERRLGRVAVVARQGLSSVSVSVSVMVHDREMRHVSMGHGKARATREMERDFRFGTARVRPTMVGSLLNFLIFVRMEVGGMMTHARRLTVRNGSHLGKAPRQDLRVVPAERKMIRLAGRGRSKGGERGIGDGG